MLSPTKTHHNKCDPEITHSDSPDIFAICLNHSDWRRINLFSSFNQLHSTRKRRSEALEALETLIWRLVPYLTTKHISTQGICGGMCSSALLFDSQRCNVHQQIALHLHMEMSRSPSTVQIKSRRVRGESRVQPKGVAICLDPFKSEPNGPNGIESQLVQVGIQRSKYHTSQQPCERVVSVQIWNR